MKYIDKFVLPTPDTEEDIIDTRIRNIGYIDNIYPCRLFGEKGLRQLDFENITILYGGNGSGKSTLLNLIASKLKLKRLSQFNSSELFDSYVKNCKVKMSEDDEGFIFNAAPHKSRIITSDDIFDYMLTARENNLTIADETVKARNERDEIRYENDPDKLIKLNITFNEDENGRLKGLGNYEEFVKQTYARSKNFSKRQFVYKFAGKEVKLNSNGQTALEYFDLKLTNDSLFCLDEPENSLSVKYQKELVDLIQKKARCCDCQFIIATHSPFVLAIDGAKIYDLDSIPVDIKKWWELENVKEYYEFFKENEELFKNN